MMARELGVTSKDVREMESRMAAGHDLLTCLPTTIPTASRWLRCSICRINHLTLPTASKMITGKSRRQNRLTDAMQGLDERSRDIIRARWLDEDNKSTLQELADRYGVSAERVRQLEKNAMKKLRAAIEA